MDEPGLQAHAMRSESRRRSSYKAGTAVECVRVETHTTALTERVGLRTDVYSRATQPGVPTYRYMRPDPYDMCT